MYDHRSDPGEHINLASRPEFAATIAEHRKWLPEKAALPAGSDEWEGDALDRRIKEWEANDSVPDWLN